MTGRVEEKPPNPMEGMTEEQKEHEAMKLVNMFDKLSRCVRRTYGWEKGEWTTACLGSPGRGEHLGSREAALLIFESLTLEEIPQKKLEQGQFCVFFIDSEN